VDANVLAFVAAVAALLATPGPTNTLLAASGAAVGVRRSLRLMAAEVSGYFLSITALMLALGGFVAAHPRVSIALKLVASVWLAWCAVQLWRRAGAAFRVDDAPISFRRVFVTTLLNPKGLVFAFVIFPRGGPWEIAPWLAGFAGLVLLVATGWIALGSALARSAGTLATPRRIYLLASLALATFAAVVAGSAVAAVAGAVR
jgi:threonine/homoserine/homoserine lactone efflux protein